MLTIKTRNLKHEEYIFEIENDEAVVSDLIKMLADKLSLETSKNEFKIIYCGKILNPTDPINVLNNKTIVYVVKTTENIPPKPPVVESDDSSSDSDTDSDSDNDDEAVLPVVNNTNNADVQRILQSIIPIFGNLENLAGINRVTPDEENIGDEFNDIQYYEDMNEGDKLNIDKICEMGYDREKVTRYYQLCERDIDKTIDLLLGTGYE